MNKHMKKKGISLITLIITLIIMALLAGAVLLMTIGNDGLFGETQTTVDLANKQTIIDEIKLQIEKKRILKLEQNQELSYEDDVIPILQQFGNYDKETFKLTTTKDNIEIRLDEVFQLGSEDYIDVTYKDKELTVTEKADLTENGYVVEYTKDNGQTWEEYEDGTIIEDVEEIIIRVVDSDGNVLGNEIIVANKLKSIYVSTPPNKTIYNRGEAFNPAGMEVTAVYHNGTSKQVTNYLYSPKTKLTLNDEQIVITYKEGDVTTTTTTPIHVIKKLQSIGVKEIRKTEYRQGEKVNLDDLTVVALYEDNSLKEVGGFTCSPSGELMSTDKEIVVSYTEYGITRTTKTPINVTYMTAIEIIQEPTKTFYVKSENFDPAGMRVKAIYANGTEREVTGFTVTNGSKLPIGQTSVTISYIEGGITKTTTQAINVRNNVTGIAVTTLPTKTTYNHNDTFNKAGMVVTATYEDGSTKAVTNYSIPNPTVIYTQTQVGISYTEKEIYTERDVTVTTNVPITVKRVLSSIAVTTKPTTTRYAPGATFNKAGMVVKATYTDSNTAVAITGYTVTNPTITSGQSSVTISYTENGTTKTTTQAICSHSCGNTCATRTVYYCGHPSSCNSCSSKRVKSCSHSCNNDCAMKTTKNCTHTCGSSCYKKVESWDCNHTCSTPCLVLGKCRHTCGSSCWKTSTVHSCSHSCRSSGCTKTTFYCSHSCGSSCYYTRYYCGHSCSNNCASRQESYCGHSCSLD